MSYYRVMPQKPVEGLRLSRQPYATLFTFSFSYIGLSAHRNFVLLLVSVASPLNNITLVQMRLFLQKEIYLIVQVIDHLVYDSFQCNAANVSICTVSVHYTTKSSSYIAISDEKKSRLTHFFRKQTEFVTFLGGARENSRKFSSENQVQ